MSDFYKRALERTEERILELEDAITRIVAGAIQSYSLNDGQTQETVTRASLASWQAVLDSLYNRRETLHARVYGSGTVTARPGW